MISNRYKAFFASCFMLLLCCCILTVSGPASAQSSVEVRASDKSGYSRLVFDWKNGANYDVAKEGDKLIVTFKNPAEVQLADISNIKNIGSVSQISAAGEPLKFAVAIAGESKFRHFKIGKRIIVDVYDSSGTPSRTASTTTTSSEPKPSEPKQDDVKQADVQSPSSEQLNKIDQVSTQQSQTAPTIDKTFKNYKEPHVITLSATKNVGLAVFERAGFLWIVQDDAGLKIPPTISGPSKDEFGIFEEMKLSGGKAYRLPMPLGTKLYGEGGGLLWRVILTQNPRLKKPLPMETKEAQGPQGTDRSVFWALDSARKVLTLTDPLIGDEIKVVTVNDTSKTVGPKRELVDMKVLPSTIGLAVVPFIDDLDVRVLPDGVSLSSAEGLAVSSASDTASLNLKDDIQKEGQLFDRLDNPRDMTKIFDFDRWEMGGARALVENRRILMVGMANKQGSEKIENLITMAKLNLANDRGPEALGLLRVAATDLPGIAETPEFLAIRGAAETLAGKFDEAVVDLLSPTLDQYDEVNYWKAAALAGLEDWQQADKVMPTSFDILDEYPTQIKEPLVLRLTEVALHAGNINIAERLLSMLEPNFPKMSVARQSAWKYLQGELERQSGNVEQALKNWEQLLTGKDDYYRAKAGLSVTRMQLERKKITPAKAIDRLEGLRYAWRGDELETLINYRLGEVYINDKQYLKGLSVLRNAISLSPNSKISEEVTDYMTTSFRDLFTSGKLEEVSPLDAVSIYDEFKELTPSGEEGDIFVQNLAERLVKVDLLGRAAVLLEDQMRYRVQGVAQAKVGIRLAAIYLLNYKADAALNALDVAAKAIQGAGNVKLKQEIAMLRARALSKKGEANKALSLLKGLPNSENMAKLRADIAWNGGLWNDAANAFNDIIAYEGISLTRPMTEYQENLILNRAIALNLSGNRTALAAVRNKYEDLMKQSEKARIFNLVTRPRKLGVLEDRESITSLISEVDLFGGFLENYRASN